MKHLTTMTIFLVSMLFITALATANNTDNTNKNNNITVVPEVIACESTGQCEMTKLELLLELDQQEKNKIATNTNTDGSTPQ